MSVAGFSALLAHCDVDPAGFPGLDDFMRCLRLDDDPEPTPHAAEPTHVPPSEVPREAPVAAGPAEATVPEEVLALGQAAQPPPADVHPATGRGPARGRAPAPFATTEDVAEAPSRRVPGSREAMEHRTPGWVTSAGAYGKYATQVPAKEINAHVGANARPAGFTRNAPRCEGNSGFLF